MVLQQYIHDDTVIDEIVDYKADIVTANLNEGDVIKVNYDYASNGRYTNILMLILAGTSTSIDSNNLSLVRIGLQTATTQLKTTVYTEDNQQHCYNRIKTVYNCIEIKCIHK